MLGEKKIMYYFSRVDSFRYMRILDRLFCICDKFCLLESPNEHREIQGNIPGLKEKLFSSKIEITVGTFMPGVTKKMKQSSHGVVQYFYHCSEEALKLLKQYNDFYHYDNKMDIAFFSKEECVLYTISNEEIIALDLDYWQTMFGH